MHHIISELDHVFLEAESHLSFRALRALMKQMACYAKGAYLVALHVADVILEKVED